MLAVIPKCADPRSLIMAGGIACLAITLSACVTINIYFPAAAAEKAADKVIDEVWQLPAGQTAQPTPAMPNSPATTQTPEPQPAEELKP